MQLTSINFLKHQPAPMSSWVLFTHPRPWEPSTCSQSLKIRRPGLTHWGDSPTDQGPRGQCPRRGRGRGACRGEARTTAGLLGSGEGGVASRPSPKGQNLPGLILRVGKEGIASPVPSRRQGDGATAQDGGVQLGPGTPPQHRTPDLSPPEQPRPYLSAPDGPHPACSLLDLCFTCSKFYPHRGLASPTRHLATGGGTEHPRPAELSPASSQDHPRPSRLPLGSPELPDQSRGGAGRAPPPSPTSGPPPLTTKEELDQEA